MAENTSNGAARRRLRTKQKKSSVGQMVAGRKARAGTPQAVPRRSRASPPLLKASPTRMNSPSGWWTSRWAS